MRIRRMTCLAACATLLGAAAFAQVGPQPAGQRVRFDGHKVVRVSASTPRQLQTVLALTDDVWTCSGAGLGTFDVRMNPEQFEAFAGTGVPHQVLIEDVQALDDASRAEGERRRANVADNPSWYDDFRTYSEVQTKVQQLAAAYPSLATFSVIGQTLQGRNIFAIRITGPGNVSDRPAILFDGTQHAREWISPMTVTYIAEQLLVQYATDPQIKGLVDNIEFLIVPIVNGDGYDYSWTTNRMWRKNRRPAPVGSSCDGVDTNRNWGYQWGSNNGSSGNPCSEIYRGTAPFSEPETQVLRNYTIANPRLVATIDFHSYSQLLLYPWGYTPTLPPDNALFTQISGAMAGAIAAVHGKTYVAGPSYATIYPTSGGIKDWMYGDQGLLAWTIELRDTGQYGFILPPNQIVPTCEENFAAVKALAQQIGPKLVFKMPNGHPGFVQHGQTNAIQVTIDDAVQTLKPGSARIYTRVGNSGAFTNTAMTSLGGSLFQGILPSAPCGQTIQYVFQAVTMTNETVKYPAAGLVDPFVTQARHIVVNFSDNAESANGWSVGGPGSNATGGIWVRNNPEQTLAQPEDDHTPAPGVYCYVTDHRAGVSAAQYDVDGGSTILTSPVMNGANTQGMVNTATYLSYWRWYSNNKGPNPNQDSLLVQLSNNAGTNWYAMEEINENADAWVQSLIRVSDILPPTTQMRVRFIASDLGGDSIVEAAVDDIELFVVGCPAPPPPPPPVCYPNCDGSTNGSGQPTLTLADMGCFQTKFALQDPYADCNGDGLLSLPDFGCFQTKFALGCP